MILYMLLIVIFYNMHCTSDIVIYIYLFNSVVFFCIYFSFHSWAYCKKICVPTPPPMRREVYTLHFFQGLSSTQSVEKKTTK